MDLTSNLKKIVESNDSHRKDSQDDYCNSLDFALDEKDQKNKQQDFSYMYEKFELKINKQFFNREGIKSNLKIGIPSEGQLLNKTNSRLSVSIGEDQKSNEAQVPILNTNKLVFPKSTSNVKDTFLITEQLLNQKNPNKSLRMFDPCSLKFLSPKLIGYQTSNKMYPLDDIGPHIVVYHEEKMTSHFNSNGQIQEKYQKESLDSNSSSGQLQKKKTNSCEALKQNCVLCDNDFLLKQIIAKTKICKHVFHVGCLDAYILKNITEDYKVCCPRCNTVL